MRASAAAATATGVLVAVLNATQVNSCLMGELLPPWLQGLILALGPGLATYTAGRRAPHTPAPPDAPPPEPPPEPPTQ